MMQPQINLSFAESLALERILAIRSQMAKRTITLPYLTNKWSRFVMKVEEEYRLTIDDYTNSLSVRDILQEVLDTCSENVSLKEWISHWDNRFVQATKELQGSLLPSLKNESQGWWWYRFPTHPGSELRKWLKFTKQA
jgi:hypothetical protein